MSQYPITVDGVRLDTIGHVSTRTGFRSAPGKRAVSVQGAHTDGVYPSRRRMPLEPGALTVTMTVVGSDWADLVERLDVLQRLFGRQRGLLTVTMDTGDVVRTCQARVVASWTPDHRTPTVARLTVPLEIPAGAWTTQGRYVATAAYASTCEVDCWDPSAPISDAQILLRDPGTAINWRVFDAADALPHSERAWLHLEVAAPLDTDESLWIDLGRWRAAIVPRPAAVWDADSALWDSPTIITDLTEDVIRLGPMLGEALLLLEPGGPWPPRRPGVLVDAIDADDIPLNTPSWGLAVRPRWL